MRSVRVELHGSTEKRVGPDRPTHNMRVGHCRLRAAAAIAGRPRHRTGAPWTNPQHAAVVDPHQRTAAGANAHNIEYWSADRQAVNLGFR